MTRFTKFALILAAVVVGTLITAALVGQAYEFRGGFSVGGEWLVSPIVAAIAEIGREVKVIFKSVYGSLER